MNLIWQNAWLAPALALTAVPVLIHLFARAKPPTYAFSSNEFIRRANRKTMRLRKPQDLLLLLIRTLLFLVLILMFLLPILYSRLFLDTGASRHVVLLVDASASMAYAEGGRTRFATATAQASEALNGLEAGDTANVIFLDRSPQGELPELSPNLGFLRERLRSARVRVESMAIEPGLSAALAQLENAPGEREIWILSDFQSTAWKGKQLQLPPDIRLVKVRIGEQEAGNVGLVSLQADPPVAQVGDKVALTAELANYSQDRRRVTAYFESGETRESRPVNLEPWSRGAVSFTTRAEPGDWEVRVKLDEDELNADNQRSLIVPVRQALRIGILAGPGGEATAGMWERALRALGQVDVRWLEEDALAQANDLDVLFLAGWPSDAAFVEQWQAWRAQGLATVWMPPAGREGEPLVAWKAEGALQRENLAQPERLVLAAPEDRLFQLFSKGEYGDPARGAFQARLRLAAEKLPETSQVLLRFNDGVAALARLPWPEGAERPGELMLWNLDLNPAVSNWSRQPEFLFFMGELVNTLAASQDAEPLTYQPGDSLVWQPEGQVVPAEVSLQDPAGAAVELLPGRPESSLMQSGPVAAAGVYAWQVRGERARQQAVNFPVVESDLRSLDPEAAVAEGGIALDNQVAVNELSEGTELWPYLLLAGVVLVLMEGGFLLWAKLS